MTDLSDTPLTALETIASRLGLPMLWNEEQLFLLTTVSGETNIRFAYFPPQPFYDKFNVGRVTVLWVFAANAALWVALRQDGETLELAYLTSERDEDYGATPVTPCVWMPAQVMLDTWDAHWLNRHRNFLRLALDMQPGNVAA